MSVDKSGKYINGCRSVLSRDFLFTRDGVVSALTLPEDADIAAYAECNPGTTKVADALTGEVLWRAQ